MLIISDTDDEEKGIDSLDKSINETLKKAKALPIIKILPNPTALNITSKAAETPVFGAM